MITERQTPDDAEALAVKALGWIAADPTLLQRFLAITGLDAGTVRHAATQPGFHAGVLRFLTDHEPTLLAFASDSGISPAAVGRALDRLPGGSGHWDRST